LRNLCTDLTAPPPPRAACAGVALVESHGEALAQELLPQFEGYLAAGAASRLGLQEDRYDLVREGVVVLLGMMAGHLAAGDDKVRAGGGGASGIREGQPESGISIDHDLLRFEGLADMQRHLCALGLWAGLLRLGGRGSAGAMPSAGAMLTAAGQVCYVWNGCKGH
jgi:hypothetical protein